MASYSMADAIRLIGSNRETIRQRVIKYKVFLSPGANPGKGRPRQLTDNDIVVLIDVQTQLDQHAPSEQVWEYLVTKKDTQTAAKDHRPPTPTKTRSQPKSRQLQLIEAQSQIISQLQLQIVKIQQEKEDALADLADQLATKQAQVEKVPCWLRGPLGIDL